jgi:hypothetical protein
MLGYSYCRQRISYNVKETSSSSAVSEVHLSETPRVTMVSRVPVKSTMLDMI